MGSSPKECFIDKFPIIHFSEKINQLLQLHPAFSPHPTRDSNPEEKRPNAVLPMASAGVTAVHPGCLKGRADTQLTRVDSERMPPHPGVHRCVCRSGLCLLGASKARKAAPPDTPHAWGPDCKAAGVWQLHNGNKIFAAPEKRRQQSSSRPHAGPPASHSSPVCSKRAGWSRGPVMHQPSVEGAGFSFSWPPASTPRGPGAL